jgi:ABC-type branched-subunit amino acid transport system ATPase component
MLGSSSRRNRDSAINARPEGRQIVAQLMVVKNLPFGAYAVRSSLAGNMSFARFGKIGP